MIRKKTSQKKKKLTKYNAKFPNSNNCYFVDFVKYEILKIIISTAAMYEL